VFAAARAGDRLALQLVEHEAELLGIGIVNLLHLFSPQAVVVGGGVAQGFDLLHPGMAQQVQARALPPFREVPVLAARLGPNSGLVGAASLVLGQGAGRPM
jgi:glucokinase